MPLLSCLSSLDVMIDTILMEKRIGKKKREKRALKRCATFLAAAIVSLSLPLP